MAEKSKKSNKNNLPQLSREGKYILSSWQEFTEQQRQRRQKEMVTVSETFGFVAYMYEKLRSAVEYRGEHVLRRATIERTLKRILWLPTQEKAELLIKELTWSRFLPNESLPKTKVKEISSIIQKYIYLLNQAQEYQTLPSAKTNWEDWLIGVASTEIEETISPSYLRTTLASLMFAWLKKNFVWDTEALTEEDREIQLFIAAQRALAKSDTPILRYRLLLLMYPQWTVNQPDNLYQINQILPNLAFQIETLLNYSQRNLVFRFVRKYTPIFIILHEILTRADNAEKNIRHPELLAKTANQLAEQKYQKLQAQVGAAIARSIIYLFITKVLLALIIELPYEIYYLKEIQYIPLIINLITPPGLMLMIGVSIRVPGQNNTQRIIKQLQNLLYQSDENRPPITAQLTLTDRQKKLNQYFSIFYILIFIVMIYFIALFLVKTVHYNILSLLVFFMFASLVILFGYRVKWESEEMTIAKHPGGILNHIVSIVTMPFISLGAWLSAGIAQINIFMFILDVIIDAPLKALVGAVEEWSQFLKLKEAEVVEVPQE